MELSICVHVCVCAPNSLYKNPPLSCSVRGDSAVADPEAKAPFWDPHGSHGMAETGWWSESGVSTYKLSFGL